jgi:serine/threonine protein kinase
MRVLQETRPVPIVKLLHDRYEIVGQAGTGGFGAVYKARDTVNNNRLVAIKAIELDTLSASQAIEATDTFNRELRLLSSLDHTHLPTIHEHFLDATHWYLVMDFIDGEPLDEYLKLLHEPCLSFREVVDIGLQLCDVLGYLHRCHPPIIFRDVKPANIMRTPGGRIYLIDFGIARRFTPGQKRDTTPLGSPGFAAPEQYGKAQTTARTDIYGLGATLYFLLTGYDPAATPFHLPPLLSLCSALPPPLAELITSMLALDPDQRPPDMAAIQQELFSYMPVTYRATARSFQIRSAQLRASSVLQAPPSVPTRAPAEPGPTRLRRTGQFLRKLFGTSLLTALLQVAM